MNTARFLFLGLNQATLLIAEMVPESVAASLLDPEWRNELLFPGNDGTVVEAAPQDSRPRRLILLDGTWRKARRILHLNPVLLELPRVTLPAGLRSRYRLRKAPTPDALSTVEAGVAALGLIEPQIDFAPLLRPFDLLIEGQIKAMGQSCYQRNYSSRQPGA